MTTKLGWWTEQTLFILLSCYIFYPNLIFNIVASKIDNTIENFPLLIGTESLATTSAEAFPKENLAAVVTELGIPEITPFTVTLPFPGSLLNNNTKRVLVEEENSVNCSGIYFCGISVH